jgi:hypothetical protein
VIQLLLADKRNIVSMNMPNHAVRSPQSLQPHPLTSVMQMAITFLSLCIAAGAIIYAVKTTSDDRNARLVEIGVSVLRVDPQKEGHLTAARRWALDLIDANAGGVRFSSEARAGLLQKAFDLRPFDSSWDTGWGSVKGGECQAFLPPQFAIEGKTPQDQYWIDLTIESGVGGCKWPRPKAREPRQ